MSHNPNVDLLALLRQCSSRPSANAKFFTAIDIPPPHFEFSWSEQVKAMDDEIRSITAPSEAS